MQYNIFQFIHIYNHIIHINVILDCSYCKMNSAQFFLVSTIFIRFNSSSSHSSDYFMHNYFTSPSIPSCLSVFHILFPLPTFALPFYFPTLPLYNFLSTGFVRHLETLAVSNSNISQQQVLAIALDATWSGPSSRALLLDKYRASCHDRSVLQGALEERRFKDSTGRYGFYSFLGSFCSKTGW